LEQLKGNPSVGGIYDEILVIITSFSEEAKRRNHALSGRVARFCHHSINGTNILGAIKGFPISTNNS
jgi:hypothetical protein